MAGQKIDDDKAAGENTAHKRRGETRRKGERRG